MKIDKKWLSIKDITKYLGISKSTVYHWDKSAPEIKFYSFLGKKIYFNKEEIDKYLFSTSAKKGCKKIDTNSKEQLKEWLSVKELCEYLSVGRSTIYKLLGSKPRINYYRIGAKKIVFNKAEIDEIITNSGD